ncbi:PEP-CTERM sorting domain-containing protein [Paucibacter sp. Y2R2-4]|uniref:PEP-CTERM sorting domain-containing protein n=1 Tax=Paucibacter sp. Y2R2-4 TaxID=2893553 RepID=UPI0021E41022|nr:PEP-CTERM sorting domain-containing protein [Paucibacter sp. Y2R2-4]MCV2351662.1 PEP-CTERM sorting domain-containing protein [Paucibacter sp. Y2R2-4]
MSFKQLASLSLIASAAVLAAAPAQAAITVADANFAYSQTFDTLASTGTTNTWANDSSIAGWSLFKTTPTTAVTAYIGDTGTSNTGGIHSYGTTAERALGSIGSTNFSIGWIAVAFKNTSADSFSGFNISFEGEQWRDGGAAAPNAQKMVLEYGFGATFDAVSTWTAPGGSFDFASPMFTNTGSGAAVDGNAAGKVSGLGGTVNAAWAANDTLWVRWVEKNDAGNDHGLAIDNVNLTVVTAAVPEPSSYAMLLAGLFAVGFVAKRRKI